DMFTINGVLDLVGLFALSAVIVLVLSSKPVLGLSRPVIELKRFNWRDMFTVGRKSTNVN
ncbi:MAG TPA: hypothetical protein VK142_12155, partial [Bacillota bacterium]|nr:hypothetical protein [Bacillota bacterium]